MADKLTRSQALRLLGLSGEVDHAEVKRAYRQQARTHHPDLGGDPGTFHELQRAYERLVGSAAAADPPLVARGRPSRPTAGHPTAPPPAATSVAPIDWDRPLPTTRTGLDPELVAVWLARPAQGLVAPLLATSRSPGSRANRLAVHLSPDLTARLAVATGRDDRGRSVVGIEVGAANRRGRRALEQTTLTGGWIRERTTTSTRLRDLLAPGDDRRATAVRVSTHLAALLERLEWPLETWTLVTEPGEG